MTGISTVLSLAAAPSFAVMALLTSVVGGAPDMLCSAGHAASALSGMTPMYLLMSAFHLRSWLELFSSRRVAQAQPRGLSRFKIAPYLSRSSFDARPAGPSRRPGGSQ